jgi:hypothetical protein
MQIGFLFHKVPLDKPTGIDQVRLLALSLGLLRLGAKVTIIAPVSRSGVLGETIPVLPLEALSGKPRFDVLKVCYHFSMELVRDYQGLLVVRLVRVVDEHLPERDRLHRDRLIASQDLAAKQASGMIFNNRENAIRWQSLYGYNQKMALIPTGCPLEIPPLGPDPYDQRLPVLLFLGSLCSTRMIHLLNETAERLQGKMAVHMIGQNKSELYGEGFLPLSPLIKDHGEKPEEVLWDYIRYARIGLALAAGPDSFDNDLSKIMSYLRGGLPILCEEQIPNAKLALKFGLAQTFRFGDAKDLTHKALMMGSSRDKTIDSKLAPRFLNHHSWSRRSEVLVGFLKKLLSNPISHPRSGAPWRPDPAWRTVFEESSPLRPTHRGGR